VSVGEFMQARAHMLSLPELDRCKDDVQGLVIKTAADILLLVGCLRLVAIGRCAHSMSQTEPAQSLLVPLFVSSQDGRA